MRQCEALGEFAIAEQTNEQDHQIDLATAFGEEVPEVGSRRPLRRRGSAEGAPPCAVPIIDFQNSSSSAHLVAEAVSDPVVGTSVPTTSNFTLFIYTVSDLSNKTPKKIPVASDGMSGRTW